MQDSDRSRSEREESLAGNEGPIDTSPASPRRRALLVSVGGALAAGLAGCSGDGDGEGDDPTDAAGGPDDSDGTNDDETTPTATDAPATDESTPSATPTEAGPAKEPMGSVRRNDVDELEIVGYQSSINRDAFSVDIVVWNAGEEPTDLEAYTWNLAPYKEDGQDVTVSAAGPPLAQDDQPVQPGEQSTVSYHIRSDEVDAVASYELYLTCEGRDADGVYCPE